MRSLRTSPVRFLLPSLLFVCSRGRNAPAEEPAPPQAIGAAYQKLCAAIGSEDLPGFMKFFDTNFVFEALDGSSVDRGPWRRLWEDRFEERAYEKALVGIEKVLEQNPERVRVRVRRALVFRKPGSPERWVEESRAEDTWLLAEGGPRLIEEREVDSPREGAIVAEEPAGARIPPEERGALEASARGPLVQEVPGDKSHRLVTFLWRERGGEEAVALRGGLPAAAPKPLTRADRTGLWYRAERLPADARFTYEFEVLRRIEGRGAGGAYETVRARSLERDPLNALAIDGRSALELPLAPPRVWEKEGAPAREGELELERLESAVLSEKRALTIYKPAGYGEAGEKAGLAILIDEGSYESRRWSRSVLDRLIAAREVPPVVVAFVHSEGSRRGRLECSAESVRFILEEALPAVRKRCGESLREAGCLLGGRGTGGTIAAACALERPGAFSALLLQSARSGEGAVSLGALRRRFAQAAKADLRIHVEWGNLDPPGDRLENAALRDVLEAKSYAVSGLEFSGDGNSATWQESLARGLAALLSGP